MARPASPRTKAAPRSEHQATYLSREQLAGAPMLTAIECSKAKSRDIGGEAVEELLAEITGSIYLPNHRNRPVPDITRGSLGISLKTLALKPVASRPLFTDWLGQDFTVPMARLQPRGPMPKGRTLADASAPAVGRRLIEAYNSMIEDYAWDRLAFLLRLPVVEESLTRYLYWEEEAAALDPADYSWRNSHRQRDEEWTRNLRAEDKSSRNAGGQRAAIGWTSAGGVLTMRHSIPDDVDTWVVFDDQVLTRAEANRAVYEALRQRMTG